MSKIIETTDGRIYSDVRQGDAQESCAGASEPGSLSSKLADSPVFASPTRSASGPAEALCSEMWSQNGMNLN